MEATDKAKKSSMMNTSEAAQLKEMDEAEMCPTCGGPMTAKPAAIPEDELGPEQGGSHGRMAKIMHTDFPGYRQRTMKRGEKVGGAY